MQGITMYETMRHSSIALVLSASFCLRYNFSVNVLTTSYGDTHDLFLKKSIPGDFLAGWQIFGIEQIFLPGFYQRGSFMNRKIVL